MRFLLALVLVMSGFLFAQESIPHFDFKRPIVYEAETANVPTDVSVSSSATENHRGKGFNYQLAFASLGFFFSFYGFMKGVDYDDDAVDLVRSRDFSSEYTYHRNREKIKDLQSERDAYYTLSVGMFAAAVFFMVSYIFF